MPPKLLTTFLAGLKANTSFGDDIRQPLFDFGPSPSFLGDSESAPSQSTAVTADSREMSAQLPRGAALLPRITPQMVIGGGSTLQTRQLWEGTVTEVGDNEFVA